jgi:hypothetical protein
MRITRKWAMPSADTFSVPPIGEFVKSYLRHSKVSIDPFARNKRWATYTNDLNTKTEAEYHLDAEEFLCQLVNNGVMAVLIIFDPPYSPRQIMECYDEIGLKSPDGGHNSSLYARCKRVINRLLGVGGVVLSFGWNTHGMMTHKVYEIEEILLVCHGQAHNDTICMAERKIAHQPDLLPRL